jgi:hypothetical protein
MSERLELSQLAKAEARRHRESLLQLFSGQPSCAIGAFCLADEVLVRSLETDVLYVNLASNNHQEKGRLASSPDPRHQLKGKAQLKDGLACDVAMVRAFPNHHAKYWLAGLSELEAPKGVLFSGDLTPSALDPEAPAGNSHELMLVLTDSEAVELRAFVRWLMTCRPATEVLPKRELLLPGSLPKLPNFKILLLTQPNKSLKREVLALIAEARNSIDVTSWAIAADNEVFAQLKAAAREKQVRLMIHDESGNRRALEELREAGAEVRTCPRMHAKVWLADRDDCPRAIVSSANLMADGLEVGYELGLRLGPMDPRIAELKAFIQTRENLIRPLGALNPVPRSVQNVRHLPRLVHVAPRLRLF